MIQKEIQSRFGMHISYRKMYNTREKVIKVVGDYDKNYFDLPKFLCELRYKDSDTYVALKMNDNQF